MKRLISLILLVFWMILIFNFSAMDGEVSHIKSKKIVRRIVENRVVVPTSEVSGSLVRIDKEEENIQKLNKDRETKINKTILKYDESVRKVAHILEYMVLILLAMNFIFQMFQERGKMLLYYLVGILFCICFACLDEFHQSHVAGRSGQMRDIWIDSIGIVIGIEVVVIAKWIKIRIRKKINN